MSLYIQQSGRHDAPALILLHGWGMSSAIWQGWLPVLEREYQVITVDLPGLGKSGFASDQPYRLDTLADLIVEQITPRLTASALWLGWSLGGLVAAQIAQRCPEKVSGLITISTSPCFVQRPDWPEAMLAETFSSFQDSLALNPQKTLTRFAMLQGQGDPDARALLRRLKPIIAESVAGASKLSESLALLADDYRSLFAELSVPRLFLFADNDALVPGAVSQSELLRNHAHLLADAGHVPFINSEPVVTQVINDWVRELADG